MKDDKKRNVKRIKDRLEKGSTFPEMPTEDIAAKHLGKSKKELKENTPDYPNTDVNAEFLIKSLSFRHLLKSHETK